MPLFCFPGEGEIDLGMQNLPLFRRFGFVVKAGQGIDAASS